MRQSQLFTKTRREAPADEVSKNAQLLIRAGFVHKEMAGVYALLPLGLRVVERIKQVVREEMNAIGGEEIAMTTLQRRELWERTGRWDETVVDAWFKTILASGGELGLAWSHEEPIADMMRSHVATYKDLPIFVYQFQNKLRNELRAKSGVMRGREFMMKDMYSFVRNEEAHEKFYASAIEAYKQVFNRVGIGADTFVTFAPGGAFTEFSHEFQTVCQAGEDIIYLNREKNIAINEEVLNEETLARLGITQSELEKVQTAEVGNIFNFGVQKSEDLDLHYTDEDGKQIPVWMGSYGIGITRLMGVLAEKFADDKGLVWPEEVAPHAVHLIDLSGGNEEVKKEAEMLYEGLTKKGVDVLFDDRDMRAGEKFADADLIGIPTRMVIGEKSLAAGGVEISKRTGGETKVVSIKQAQTI